LVREFSWLDGLIVSWASSTPCLLLIALQIILVASAYPGADIGLSTFLGFVFWIPLAIIYYLLARSMPRTGGDYVWSSRLIHPIVGFVAAWSIWIALAGVTGIISWLQAAVIVPLSSATLGYAFGNPYLVSLSSLFSEPSYVVVIGLVNIIAASAINAFGPRVYSRTMIALSILVFLSTAISIVVLATASHSDFVNALNGYGGENITYDGIISQATASGWSLVPLAFAPTLFSTPLAVMMFAGSGNPAIASGEIRNPRRSMLLGIVLALFLAFAVNFVGIELSANLLGYEFIQASLAVSWPLAAAPWMPLFVTMLLGNGVLIVLVIVGFLVTLTWSAAAILLVATRYVFAFSFDRAFPTGLADVHPRFHSPLKATLVNATVGFIFLLLATYTSFVGLYLNNAAIYCIMYAVGSAAAAVLPFRNREIAKTLPGSNWRVPLVTIIGSVSFVLMVLSFYFAITTPAVGPSTVQANVILATIYVIGLIVYGARYFQLKKQGFDLGLVYKEIPPE
jgi:amino acid transporter